MRELLAHHGGGGAAAGAAGAAGSEETGPDFLDINEAESEVSGWTALHIAARLGYHELAELLLAHPAINVNQRTRLESTALLEACYSGHYLVVRVLLGNPRIDVNLADAGDRTPLWWAAYKGHVDVVVWMLALRGVDLDLERPGVFARDLCLNGDGRRYSPLDVVAEKKKTVVFMTQESTSSSSSSRVDRIYRILAGFVRSHGGDPTVAQHRLRMDLGITEARIAEFFALVVFLCDDYLALVKNARTGLEAERTAASRDRGNEKKGKNRKMKKWDDSEECFFTRRECEINQARFLDIATRLPLDLQMTLCHRVCKSPGHVILQRDSELAFKAVVARWITKT